MYSYYEYMYTTLLLEYSSTRVLEYLSTRVRILEYSRRPTVKRCTQCHAQQLQTVIRVRSKHCRRQCQWQCHLRNVVLEYRYCATMQMGQVFASDSAVSDIRSSGRIQEMQLLIQ